MKGAAPTSRAAAMIFSRLIFSSCKLILLQWYPKIKRHPAKQWLSLNVKYLIHTLLCQSHLQ